MFNIAKCPKCDQPITSVHFEQHEPSFSQGGSSAFVATVFPCGHALSGVPVVWENMLIKNSEDIKRQNQQIQNMEYQINTIQNSLNQIIALLNRNR